MTKQICMLTYFAFVAVVGSQGFSKNRSITIYSLPPIILYPFNSSLFQTKSDNHRQISQIGSSAFFFFYMIEIKVGC